MSTLEEFRPQVVGKNSIYDAEKGQYCSLQSLSTITEQSCSETIIAS